MRTIRNPVARAWGSVACALAAALSLPMIEAFAQQPTETDAFLAALKYREKLKTFTPPVQSQAQNLKTFVDIMLGQYDRILTMGPGAERMSVVKMYESDRVDAVAREANLATALNRLKPHLDQARECLSTYRDFSYLEVWKELDTALTRALDADYVARRIPRPPPLPDPLPDKAVPPLQVIEVGYARPIVVGEMNEFNATVRCNYQMGAAYGTVEARVRGGSAVLHDEAVKSVNVQPQGTVTLTWRFTATAEGDVKISARVVR